MGEALKAKRWHRNSSVKEVSAATIPPKAMSYNIDRLSLKWYKITFS